MENIERVWCKTCWSITPIEIMTDDAGNIIKSCKWCGRILEVEMIPKAYEEVKNLLSKKDELEELIRQVNLYLPEITKKGDK